MILLQSLLSVDKTLGTPVYLQVANGVINHIRKGTLKPGSALPASRVLATALVVHRKTIVAAYDELYAQSWVEVYPRKGIFVAKNLPDVSPRPLVAITENSTFPNETYFSLDTSHLKLPALNSTRTSYLAINDGFPDTRIAPVDLIVREYRRFAGYHFTSKYLLYGPEQGSENLRNELVSFLADTRGLNICTQNILITKGAQMAIYLISRLMITAGDTVIVGDPGYTGGNEVFEQAGAQLALVSVDSCGINLDEVEAICERRPVKLLYVVPHHHQPTTVTLSAERRMRLLELAIKYKFAIIEDDYDYDFHYTSGPLLPLASADSCGSVIYVGSFGKIIAPGIRIGFMVAPQNFIHQATRLRRLIDRQGEQLLEEAMANLLKNGDINRHLKKANKLYHERRDTFVQLLQTGLGDKISFKIPDGGFAIWAQFTGGFSTREVARKAAELGLVINEGCEYFYDTSEPHSYIRLGFASLNLKEQQEAVAVLVKAVESLWELRATATASASAKSQHRLK